AVAQCSSRPARERQPRPPRPGPFRQAARAPRDHALPGRYRRAPLRRSPIDGTALRLTGARRSGLRRSKGKPAAGPPDLLDVPVIGAATPSQHVEPGKATAQADVVVPELDRVAGVQIRGLVQLRVAAFRGVGPETAE